MQIVADKQGFSVRAFQEQWFYCPVVSAVDADGKSDRDDPYVPVLSFAQEQGADGARYLADSEAVTRTLDRARAGMGVEFRRR